MTDYANWIVGTRDYAGFTLFPNEMDCKEVNIQISPENISASDSRGVMGRIQNIIIGATYEGIGTGILYENMFCNQFGMGSILIGWPQDENELTIKSDVILRKMSMSSRIT